MIKKDGNKVTAKQWVAESTAADLDLVFDFYYERYASEWEEMTERERDQIQDQMNQFRARVEKILARTLKGMK
jgi:hypothetical protein